MGAAALMIDWRASLTTETVQGSTLSLQSVDNVQGSDGLSLCVFCVSDCVSDDILKESLKDCSHFFVDECRNSLNTTSSSESSDCWLSDTLDVISKNLSVSLSTTLT